MAPRTHLPNRPYHTFAPGCVQELAWASHLAVPAVMLPSPPSSSSCANYARILHQAVSQPCIMQLWCRVPLVARAAVDEEEEEDDLKAEARMEEEEGAEEAEQEDGGEGGRASRGREDPWESWDRLRTLCEFDASLGVALGACERSGG